MHMVYTKSGTLLRGGMRSFKIIKMDYFLGNGTYKINNGYTNYLINTVFLKILNYLRNCTMSFNQKIGDMVLVEDVFKSIVLKELGGKRNESIY